MKAAIIGGGVIGSGWAARFLLNGWDVNLYDPDPQAERKMQAVLDNARRALPALYDQALPQLGKLSITTDLAAALQGVQWIQESIPERLDLKLALFKTICAINQDAIIASSTSGFTPDSLNGIEHNVQSLPDENGRVIVAHPFNPVYLLPIVELVGANAQVTRAKALLESIGMLPIIIKKQIDAHVGDRLLEALWREALWLVHDDVATTEDIDQIIRMGFGLRWAQMGLFETYRIAGGEAGMAHFLAQFGPALKWPWTKLMDVPELDDRLINTIAAQSDAQSGHMSIRQLERLRDDNLVGMMRALRKNNAGVGAVIAAHEKRLRAQQAEQAPAAEQGGFFTTVTRQIPASWSDYNGHMNETHYLELGSQASDVFLELIGFNPDDPAKQYSFFTVESHVVFADELAIAEQVQVKTEIVHFGGKKLHLMHHILNVQGAHAASVETLLVHIDLGARRACPLGANFTSNLERMKNAQQQARTRDNESEQANLRDSLPQAGRSIRF